MIDETRLQGLPSDWDTWDICVFLGIEDLQPDDIRNIAPNIDRSEAHLFTVVDGERRYTNPEAHRIRSTCRFPGFNTFQMISADRAAYTLGVAIPMFGTRRE